MFQKLEQLTPTELSRQLSRIYVYNMNTAFRYDRPPSIPAKYP